MQMPPQELSAHFAVIPRAAHAWETRRATAAVGYGSAEPDDQRYEIIEDWLYDVRPAGVGDLVYRRAIGVLRPITDPYDLGAATHIVEAIAHEWRPGTDYHQRFYTVAILEPHMIDRYDMQRSLNRHGLGGGEPIVTTMPMSAVPQQQTSGCARIILSTLLLIFCCWILVALSGWSLLQQPFVTRHIDIAAPPPAEEPAPPPAEEPAPPPAEEPAPPPAPMAVSLPNGLQETAQQERDMHAARIYVENRIGAIHEPFTAQVVHDGSCALHGYAETAARVVTVVACAQHTSEQVVNLMVHEIAHQAAHDHYGDAHVQADMILLEGLATWGAGRYWLGPFASFRGFVREHYQLDTLLPLATPYNGHDVQEMNQLYYQWASFVEFLLETYGRESLDALYVTGQQQRPGSADYVGVYGKDLATLEQEWRAWLAAP